MSVNYQQPLLKEYHLGDLKLANRVIMVSAADTDTYYAGGEKGYTDY